MADTGSPFNIPYVEPTDLVRDYPAASQDLADRIAGQFAAGFQFAGTRYYTSSGSFAKADPLGTGDIGLRAVRVRVQGAGGGGGATQATTAGQFGSGRGGSAGGFAEKFYGPADVAGFASSITVTRGGGGAGGDGSSGVTTTRDGAAGGNSTFLTLTAVGGARGGRATESTSQKAIETAGVGGVGTNGDLNVAGGPGGGSIDLGAFALGGISGFGGNSVFGGGGKAVRHNAADSANGLAGTSPGAGGSGGASGENAAANFGGAGANGIVIIDCFV